MKLEMTYTCSHKGTFSFDRRCVADRRRLNEYEEMNRQFNYPCPECLEKKRLATIDKMTSEQAKGILRRIATHDFLGGRLRGAAEAIDDIGEALEQQGN